MGRAIRTSKSSWLAAALLLPTTVASVPIGSEVKGDTGGYPYWDMPCEHSPYATKGGPDYCVNYDWGPKHTKSYNDPSEISPYGYAYRNCTDFVAWKLATLGVPATIYKNHGNGAGWASIRGLLTNTIPAAGAVAVQTSGRFGHVAFITSVNGATISIAEYNYYKNGTYDTRSGTLASLGFNKVTHFEKFESRVGHSVSAIAEHNGNVDLFAESTGGVNRYVWGANGATRSGVAARGSFDTCE